MVKLDVMEQNETIRKLLPPRVVDSITSGVNRIEKQPYLLLFPLLFDLFLWLGPILSIQAPVMRIYNQLLMEMENIYSLYNMPSDVTQPLYEMQTPLADFLSNFNLLSVAKTFPIGIPGLLANVNTSISPMGPSQLLELSSIGNIIAAVILIAFCGIILGTIFLHILSPKTNEKHQKSIVQQLANSLAYSFVLLVAIITGALLATFIASFFAIFLQELGQLVLFLIIMSLMVLLLPALYAFIPIFAYGQSFYQAIITSYKVVGLQMRYKLQNDQTIIISPRIITFTMAIFILYQGLNIVWLRLPPIDSWWMILGILGHAFTSTLVLISCFDFFHKMCEWRHNITQQEVC